MNRDMDLCRRVLLAIEDSPPSKTVQFFNFTGAYPKDTVAEHVVLLEEAGLLEANIERTFDGIGFSINRLTWDGHDFLDAARDEGRWVTAKQCLADAGVNISFALLKEKLEDLARKALGS